MGLKIKKAEIMVGDKKKVFLANRVEEMGFVGAGAFAVDLGDGIVETYWFCPTVLTQEDVPDIIEAPRIVGAAS